MLRCSGAVLWEDLRTVAYLAAGGAIGTVLRYGVSLLFDSSRFPWGTFAVNFAGSFLLAIIFFYLMDGPGVSVQLRLFLFVGVFGAFTTMSTFTVDTVSLFVNGHYGLATSNVMLNAFLCLLGAFAGRFLSSLL